MDAAAPHSTRHRQKGEHDVLHAAQCSMSCWIHYPVVNQFQPELGLESICFLLQSAPSAT